MKGTRHSRTAFIAYFSFLIIIPLVLEASTSGSFLTMPVSAREAGLGGAMAAVSKEIDSVTFNPAGLSGFDGFGISLLYSRQLFGNMYGKAVIVHPAGFGMLGIAFAFLSTSFDETFEFGAKAGSKSLSDINLALAFQRDLSENFSFGIGAKFISVDLGEAKASTAGADIGILYQINPKSPAGRFNIGAGVRNLGLGLKFDKENESLPMTIYGGIMFQPIQLISLQAEVDMPKDMDIEFGGGLEFHLFNLLKPRVGYRAGNGLSDITAGLYIGREFGSTTLGLDYGMDMGVEISHVVELKIQRPAFFEFGAGAEKIPYDGKNPTKIAVSEIEVPKGLDANLLDANLSKTIAEWLRGDWSKSKALSVVARENMAKILKEQEVQMTGITSEKDAAAIGEILNVQYMVLGSISMVGSEYYIDLKVVNVSTGRVETSAEEVSGSKATLRLAAKKLAMKLDPAYQE
ncbi:MAG: PorV/PorQ family protein [bacterium]|nr:PorV/PorQ family protein [bacterium]